MSENILDADDLFDDSADVESSGEESAQEVGKTSDESSNDPEGAADSSDEKKSLLSGFTLFDSMLLIALICVSLATLLLLVELNTFGKFPGSFPWRTNEFLK